MALELLGAVGNAIGSLGSSIIQNEIGKKNEERQWNRYYSPKAQVNNLAAAGINPAVAFGNQSPQLLPGGSMQSPTVENLGLGTTALSEIGAYIQAKSTAAKTQKETGKVDAETKKLLSELDAQELQNDLVRQFGNQKWTYDVAQAYQNVLLAKKTNDIKEQEKAINEYHKVTAYLESNLKGTELRMVKKRLGNLDKQIELENKLQTEKIATERSVQGANRAAAGLAQAQTKTEDVTRDYKAFAIDLANHMQGLEYAFNIDTYQQRLEKFAHEVGIVKWTEFLNSVEAKDREAYNAVQRIIMGKGSKQDGKTLWNLINDGRQLIPFK